jgi:NitT/TauT family transport system substrate-binding protein
MTKRKRGVAVILSIVLALFVTLPVFAQQEENIRVGVIPLVEHIPLILAQKDTNLSSKTKVSLDIYTSWTGLEAAFRTGAIEAACVTLPKALLMAYEGISLNIIMVVNRNGISLALKGESAEALKGKIIGSSGNDTMDLIVFARFLKEKKLKLGYDARLMLIPFSKAISLLKEERIYGFCLPEPYGAQAEQEGVAKKVLFSKDIYPNHIGNVLIVNPKVLKTNSEVIKLLVKNIVKAGAAIEKDKKDSQGKQTSLTQVDIFKIPPALVARSLTMPKDRITFDNVMPSEREVEEIMQDLMSLGLMGGKVNLKDIIDTKYLN